MTLALPMRMLGSGDTVEPAEVTWNITGLDRDNLEYFEEWIDRAASEFMAHTGVICILLDSWPLEISVEQKISALNVLARRVGCRELIDRCAISGIGHVTLEFFRDAVLATPSFPLETKAWNARTEVLCPDHYNQRERECIDAMRDLYGDWAVALYSHMNGFKYQWRKGDKIGESIAKDNAKTNWYMAMSAHCLLGDYDPREEYGKSPYKRQRFHRADLPLHVTPYVALKRPKTICLCGSMRFETEFRRMNLELGLSGFVVLSVSAFSHSIESGYDKERIHEAKDGLDELHRWKIMTSDAVIVVTNDDYINTSTYEEIGFAERIGRPVFRYDSAIGCSENVVLEVNKYFE
jgi:hypothetical protein